MVLSFKMLSKVEIKDDLRVDFINILLKQEVTFSHKGAKAQSIYLTGTLNIKEKREGCNYRGVISVLF